MKRIIYNKVDELLKELILFFSSLLFFLFFTTYLVAQDFKHTEVVSEGRAVIIEGDEETARKREEAGSGAPRRDFLMTFNAKQ